MAEKRLSPFDDDRGGNKRSALGDQSEAAEGPIDIVEQIVRPMFWTGYTGEGRKRTVKGRDTTKELKAAYNDIIHLEGELTFNQQRELFPYIFWPPIQNWCLVPFDMQACPKEIRTDEGQINPLIYGLGAKSSDHIWKQAVFGIFEPQRRCYLIFDHILIAIHFPWADETSVDEVSMWGLVHYQKGSGTAYVHVMTQWQEWVFNNNLSNTRWAGNLVQTLTGEEDIDENLFLGDNPAINIQWMANLTGPDWNRLGARGETAKEMSEMSFLYVIYAATTLAVDKSQDNTIPEFGVDDSYGSLAQALLGVSTALDHGEEGGIRSVFRDGLTEVLPENATERDRLYREKLEQMVAVAAADYQKAWGADPGLSQDLPLLSGNPQMGSGTGS
ncbi:hypothetical protein VMCG_08894 [Cytospora schulzeri]|uniref:Uncharacterized protein n=1 Tax=Cytospora schulzeri TaxID=448051 RepID=A0A423VUV4_9PEZI|nr:hypothetical protein VMCG_08894 [Valsa malicola]